MSRFTHAPVRRFSQAKGREGLFWQPFAVRDRGRIMLAAERFERTRREPDNRNGPLGPVGLEVLRELLRLIDFKSGRLEPAITTLMSRLKRSKDAIVSALANLRRHGFLDWIRRWVEGEDGRPHQTSNAYRLVLPPAALRLLGRLAEDAPEPDDIAHGREARAEETAAMLHSLPGDELPGAVLGDGELTDMLSRMWRRNKNEAGQ